MEKRNQSETKSQNSLSSIPVFIQAGTVDLNADLTIPPDAKGLVIFAHGSGSSRQSPRNRYVATVLNENHLGTILADLLTADEESIDRHTRHLRFDISLLSGRLQHIMTWAQSNADTKNLLVGLFGASTGAAAALIAAARQSESVKAVVSRGGRPDLAMDFLSFVKAPTLLIVGENDTDVIHLNRIALERLNTSSSIEIVPGATHLFEEPGTLEDAAKLAAVWFRTYLQ